jgi:hypothetical protein
MPLWEAAGEPTYRGDVPERVSVAYPLNEGTDQHLVAAGDRFAELDPRSTATRT